MRILPVSIASHSPLMTTAQEKLNEILASLKLKEPLYPIIGNSHALPMYSSQEILADLHVQLIAPVRWSDSIRYLIQQGVQYFIEIGSGSVLKNLIKRIDDQVTCFSLGTVTDFENLPKLIAV